MLGKDIVIGTALLWYLVNGTYYRETCEAIRTVESITLTPEYEYADALMTFKEDNHWPKRQWFIVFDKEYKTADEYANRSWLDGDPNNPL